MPPFIHGFCYITLPVLCVNSSVFSCLKYLVIIKTFKFNAEIQTQMD